MPCARRLSSPYFDTASFQRSGKFSNGEEEVEVTFELRVFILSVLFGIDKFRFEVGQAKVLEIFFVDEFDYHSVHNY